MILLFSLNGPSHKIFRCHDKEFMKRRKKFHVDETCCILFLKNIKPHEINIGDNKFHFIPSRPSIK
jgi:hypothetical protein